MITAEELEKIKAIIEEFLQKVTAVDAIVALSVQEAAAAEVVVVTVTLPEPQLFIGQNGQTLLEMERLLRMMLCKNLQKNLYVSLDINEYKKKKVEHVKKLATDTAREVVITGEKKTLPPMSSYERRIIHDELANNTEVSTESEGEGTERRVVIKPK